MSTHVKIGLAIAVLVVVTATLEIIATLSGRPHDGVVPQPELITVWLRLRWAG